MKPVRLGMTGIHGYARYLNDVLHKAYHEDNSRLQLAAITAPEIAQFPDRVAELQNRGVAIIDSYDEMLNEVDIDAVWLPLPIDMHVPFTERALAAGKPVMVEKPVAATVQECDRLIAARDAAALPVTVGYTTIYDPATLTVKRRLLAGELGALRKVTMLGCWPRTSHYYNRSEWVGRIRRNGQWVLDSPANNAMSHYLNLVFFLLGEQEDSSIAPTRVEAELYRANEIENYDTCSLGFEVDRADSPRVLMMFTHVCAEQAPTTLIIEGERGRMIWTRDVGVRFEVVGRPPKFVPVHDARCQAARRFAKLVRGVPDPDIAVSTLETARMQTLAVNGASEAAAVHAIPADRFQVQTLDDGATLRVVSGIAQVFERALARGLMLHQSGEVDWSVPAGSLDLRGYDRFTDVATSTIRA